MLLKQPLEFYSEPLAGVDTEELQGKLIVIEGPDSVGRSTQVWHLSPSRAQQSVGRQDSVAVCVAAPPWRGGPSPLAPDPQGPGGAGQRSSSRRSGGQRHLAGQGRQYVGA